MNSEKNVLKKEYLLQISEMALHLYSDREFPIPDHLALFGKSEEKNLLRTADRHYQFVFVDEIPVSEGEAVTEWDDMRVYRERTLETRVFIDIENSREYGCYQEISTNEAKVYLLNSYMERLTFDTFCCSLLALERHVMKQSGFILHCAFNEYKGQAVLFSAPSETGKTTHANLWNRYQGSRTVNGDRALLRKIDGTWYACGWPICGSSEICFDEKYPIHSIVMIHQAKENAAFRLTAREAFRQIYSQITINRWNIEHQVAAMDVLDSLIKDIAIYQLNCDISEEAVLCIKETIKIE